MADPRIELFRQALLSMSSDPQGSKVLELLKLDGFVAAEPSLFDTIAAKVEAVRQFG
jgi:phosphonate transport system substrate-binding protein